MNFQEIVSKMQEVMSKVKELWQEDTTYMVYVVPTNGKSMKQKNFHTNFFRKVVYGVCGFAVFSVATLGVMQHTIYKNHQIQAEITAYNANKAVQEQKLQELNTMTAKVQEDMARLAKVEEQVRQQMQKSGMHVPQKTLDAAKYAGKGGNGDMSKLMTQINVSLEQNKNMHAQLTAETKDWQQLLDSLKEANHKLDYTPNQWPLESRNVTSRFGGRRDPVYGGRENHPGIDIGADYGTPVYAAANGTIEQAEWYGGYGKFILIKHDYGYETAYGHLSSLNVQPGQEVQKGDFIGRVGSTGYSTGPHLHFEVRQDGKQVNPMRMF